MPCVGKPANRGDGWTSHGLTVAVLQPGSTLGGKRGHRFALAHPPAGKRSAAASFWPPLWALAYKAKAPQCGAEGDSVQVLGRVFRRPRGWLAQSEISSQ
ncbi:hypothetical protein KAM448_42070 [Aeromonas caviae]|uniref:Uncharacterized protein n=1 Tax=Aeromonas caviae TaxID=648 RepID=A0ABD0BD84_AERCA|nr:hypothetical protein KAM355_42290 [Aeromonas caviae]GJB13338.1 hypothetical protein KAM362_38980 [Aeromonas caviae]GJB26499.1 hypothetical protein KAM365_42490 [Aeromonas caviae]GJB35133.1 hypothetical protein KAM367_42350 [Aeromonas caviae]GJB43842.1 hypothetical protein KAM369_43170 [Aeromonas caviae]